MSDQPEALRLADMQSIDAYACRNSTAAELRRLHAENKSLRAALEQAEPVDKLTITEPKVYKEQAEPVVDLYAVQSAVLIEREACARLCESTTAAWTQHLYNEACMDCAKAIRGQNVPSEPDDASGNPSW